MKPEVIFQIAVTHGKRGEYEKALGCIDQIIQSEIGSKNRTLCEGFKSFLEGMILAKERRYDVAIEKLRASLDVKSDDFICLTNIGYCYFMTGHFETALEYINMALGINPSFKVALHNKREIESAIESMKVMEARGVI